RTVDIGIRHNDYLVVSELSNIKIIADTRTQCGYNGHNLVVTVNLVDSRLFNIEHFTPKRQNSLNSSVTASLCGTARRVTLYDEYFGFAAVPRLTVSKF